MTLPDSWLESPPGTTDLTMVRGTTFQRRIRLLTPDPDGDITVTIDGVPTLCSAVDLTGVTGDAAVRDRAGNLLLSLAVAVLSPATDGWLKVSATATATAGLPEPAADVDWSSRWDLHLVDGSDRICPVRGRVRILDDLAEVSA